MAKDKRLIQLLDRIPKRIIAEYRMLKNLDIANVEGINISVGDHISKPIRRRIYGGYYEEAELLALKSQLCSNDIVMELGAGIGFISSYCAARIGSDKVFTYEGNPLLEPHILNTFALNGVSPKLEISLLGKVAGEQTFYISKDFWSSSTIQRDLNAKALTVPVKSLNEEIKRVNPTFLIIDIEGGEYELFQYIDFHNVNKIIIELHERVIGTDKIRAVKSSLADAGFHINNELSSKTVDEVVFLKRSLGTTS